MIRTRESIVYTPSMQSQHTKLKKDLNQILNREVINIRVFLRLLWMHQRSKYQAQIEKITMYVAKLETGENMIFKTLYEKDNTIKVEER